jgi:hypothetical protein
LSLGNKNVYHEVGYLMGLNKCQGAAGNNFILFHNRSITNSNLKKDVGFNLTGHSVLTVKDTNELREKIKEQIKKYYNF